MALLSRQWNVPFSTSTLPGTKFGIATKYLIFYAWKLHALCKSTYTRTFPFAPYGNYIDKICYVHPYEVSYTLLLDWPALGHWTGHWTGHWQPGVARWNPHKPHPFRNSMGAILLGYFMVSIFNSYTNGWYMHVRVCTCTFSV